MLIASNCTEIIRADSILLWDEQQTINLLSTKNTDKDKVIAISETQIKKSKRQILKYKFGMIGVGVIGIVSNCYLLFRN